MAEVVRVYTVKFNKELYTNLPKYTKHFLQEDAAESYQMELLSQQSDISSVVYVEVGLGIKDGSHVYKLHEQSFTKTINPTV